MLSGFGYSGTMKRIDELVMTSPCSNALWRRCGLVAVHYSTIILTEFSASTNDERDGFEMFKKRIDGR
jgi:hypothetical protein